jgi:hypothetical protein
VAVGQYQRIQNALVNAVKGGAFYPVVHDKDTHLATVDDSTPLAPEAVQANEEGSAFEGDARRATGLFSKRVSWSWLVTATWNTHISGEAFEEAQETTIKLPRSGALEAVALRLVGADYDHPGEQSAKGSKVTYSFDVELLTV